MREKQGLTLARAIALIVVLGLAFMGGFSTVLAVVLFGVPLWAIFTLVRWQHSQRGGT